MLISKKVIDLNNERHNSITKERDETRSIKRNLNIFNRTRVERIDDMIFRLYYDIERTSGWSYTPSSFIHKSNYRYNPTKNEIEFDIDRVELTDDGYKPTTNNQFELDFLTTYQEPLKRLSTLHQKKGKIISPYQNEYKNFVINFTTALNQKRDTDGIPTELAVLAIQSNNFIDKYGIDGIKRLVNLLNELASSNPFDPLTTYNNQFKGSVTNLYIKELFRWAASFTPKAQYVIDALERRREELDRELTPELRKLIR